MKVLPAVYAECAAVVHHNRAAAGARRRRCDRRFDRFSDRTHLAAAAGWAPAAVSVGGRRKARCFVCYLR